MALPALAAVVTSVWIGIGGDERYALGGLRAAPGGPAEIFVHRPLAYRLLLWLLDLGPRLFTPGDESGPVAEGIIRGEALILAGAVCLLVWAGIRQHRPEPMAGLVACAMWVAFALAPNWTFLEPDWAGALWAAATIGAALLPRRTIAAAPLAGVFVLLCVATKLATAPYVLIAAGVVWLLDRRRTYATAAWSVGLVAAWAAGTWLFEPLELQWLRDMSALIPNTVLHAGLGDLDWRGFGESAANLAIVSPIVLAIPSATVALARGSRRPGLVVLGVLVAVMLTAVPVLAQAEWFLYQWAALPVLAAGLAAAALVQHRSPAPVAAVLVPLVAGGLGSGVAVLTAPVQWRASHLTPVVVGYVAFSVVAVVWGLLVRLPRLAVARTHTVAALSAVAAVVAFGAANVPNAGYSFAGYHADETNLSAYQLTAQTREQFAQLRAQIGPDTPVLYLAFGDINYLLGNPTDCRYPSPVWLQRSTYLPYVRDFPSYQDNLGCLTTAARYLIVEQSWFDLSKLAPDVATRLEGMFDCDHALHANDDLLACPRR